MTHAQDFADGDFWRLVAEFPLNGNRDDAYTVWHHAFPEATTPDEAHEMYAICDNYGFNFASSLTFWQALDYCTRNCGWGELRAP